MDEQRFRELWRQHHPALYPPEVRGTDDPCAFATKFRELAEERILSAVRRDGDSREKIWKAQLLLAREYHTTRHKLPAGHQGGPPGGHPCVFDVYCELWDQLDALEMSLFDTRLLADTPAERTTIIEPVSRPVPQHYYGTPIGELVPDDEEESEADVDSPAAPGAE